MPDTPRHVDNDALVNFNLCVVQDHRALPFDDVVDLVSLGVNVQLGVVDLDIMDLGGGAIALFDEWTDLAAGFPPRLDL